MGMLKVHISSLEGVKERELKETKKMPGILKWLPIKQINNCYRRVRFYNKKKSLVSFPLQQFEGPFQLVV